VTDGRGKLVLCGTPIGNLEDISARALKLLGKADIVACEDVRRTRKLLTHYQVKARALVVYNDETERRKAGDLVDQMKHGRTVALVSDAGMPGLSDPGFRLVRACIDAGLDVEVVPGPTAVVSALALSGLPTARFVFEGWLPRKDGERRRRVAEIADEQRTIVLFVSPHRVGADLDALLEGLGDRRAALARELTKLHEEVRRGSLSELVTETGKAAPRGEMVLVVEGAAPVRASVPPDRLAARARELMDKGVPRKEALTEVARELGVPRREVFNALVERPGGLGG
jgi:16S rRNA (cytidine1402-2'-O)-methyltransferase